MPQKDLTLQAFVRGVLAFLALWIAFLAGLGLYVHITMPDFTRLKEGFPSQTAWMARYVEQKMALHARKPVIRYSPVPLQQIPRFFQRAVVLAEDAAFWQHHGVDWHELKASLRKNLKARRIVRGGSTITQQLVKNLYLGPERTLFRKIKEIYWATGLERQLSKTRILELYLNCIEFGPGIFGVQAASRYYFGKSIGNLNPSQMLRLAAILPNPHRLHPGRPNRALQWRTRVILNRLYRYSWISDSTYFALQDSLQHFFAGGGERHSAFLR